MTMFILAICAGMCQINLYWRLRIGEAGAQGSRGAEEQRSSTSLREASPVGDASRTPTAHFGYAQ
ncbi:hypothetical protein [Nostoc sp. DedQUE09]|uniref:hypothetical protein n=1 Tax=Nostoc sp. DedQUE09 TaxID=3075394 RepID=UPI002AD4D2EB|nr:hypothetical protein [Nostoc sp. DedQUE09]MDZ7952744.1 hypothetical protein [Nostoc sp. DedQUE09]